MTRKTSGALERGIRRDAHGLQAYVFVNGRQRAKRFPLDTPIGHIRAWREDQRVGARHQLEIGDEAPGGFRRDVRAYLDTITDMPTFEERKYRMAQWVEAFGLRSRHSITPAEIRQQLARWKRTGRYDGGPLSGASLNRRRTDLMHFYTVMNGRGAANPVKDVPAYPEHAGDQVRAHPWRVWYRLLARIGSRRWASRRPGHQGQRAPDSKTRARLRLMLWTGWPHKQIAQLTPRDIDWAQGRVRVSRRQKGRGGHPAKWIPVLPPALVALRAFERADAWGPFSASSMHSALARAVAAENAWRTRWRRPTLPAIRPYDARHSALTLMATLTSDERVLQELALHSSASQTRRYTEGATEARLQAAIAEMSQAKV